MTIAIFSMTIAIFSMTMAEFSMTITEFSISMMEFSIAIIKPNETNLFIAISKPLIRSNIFSPLNTCYNLRP